MKKILLPLTMAFGLFATSAHADQETLDAIVASGVTLNNEQTENFPKERCEVTFEQVQTDEISERCLTLVDSIAGLVAENSGNDQAVESILRSAAGVHPPLANLFGEASLISAPESIALIAGLMTELAPTAAGIDVADAGNIPNNNAPVSTGAGGASSPN